MTPHVAITFGTSGLYGGASTHKRFMFFNAHNGLVAIIVFCSPLLQGSLLASACNTPIDTEEIRILAGLSPNGFLVHLLSHRIHVWYIC